MRCVDATPRVAANRGRVPLPTDWHSASSQETVDTWPEPWHCGTVSEVNVYRPKYGTTVGRDSKAVSVTRGCAIVGYYPPPGLDEIVWCEGRPRKPHSRPNPDDPPNPLEAYREWVAEATYRLSDSDHPGRRHRLRPRDYAPLDLIQVGTYDPESRELQIDESEKADLLAWVAQARF
jgi:hypothetical protein